MTIIVDARAELWRYVLDTPVGGSGVASVDLLLVELETASGTSGLGFSYVLSGRNDLPLAAARDLIARFVAGTTPGHPIALWRRIAASFNRTGGGPYRTALAAIDVAAWDLYAKTIDLPLGIAMGGEARSVPVYGSGGFTAHQTPNEAAAVASGHLERGMRAVKLRASATDADAARVAAVVRALDGRIPIMIDANERCTLTSATRLLHIAADAGAIFVEEPLPAAMLSGYRALARHAPLPIAVGEHLESVEAAAPFIAGDICAVMQPDLAAMGGLTPALRTAQLAEHANVEIAPHFLPGLFVHLAAAASNVTWLEEFPLLEPLLSGWPLVNADGTMTLCERTGHGLQLADGARERYRI